ncbi:hypothetical protein CCUG63697_00001 [Mycobacteroides franklinii]|uniref:Uncharacterized protein n=1 Tax=Mycobacteroides franklinii TaxID=948102 RepID=A0A4R8RIG5_9MYCO|nr:hypothetical protein CCUG63697_00001 [Mycobacteroides franklinii]
MTLPCSAASTGPTQPNMSLAAVTLIPIELPSWLMLSTSLAPTSTLRTSLSPPY